MLGGCEAGRAPVGTGGCPQTVTKCVPHGEGWSSVHGAGTLLLHSLHPHPLSRGHSPGSSGAGAAGAAAAGAGEPGSPASSPGACPRPPATSGDPVLLPGRLSPCEPASAPLVLTASCYLGFSFFVVGRPGDPSVKLHGAATEGGAGHGRAGSPAENLPCPGRSQEWPHSGLCLLLVPPLPLPPGGCVLSHVGWAWAGS